MNLIEHASLQQYRNRLGIFDLEKVLSEAKTLGIRVETFPHNGKKLTKLALADGQKFYVKPTSYRGASAEKIIATIYKSVGLKTPETTIAMWQGNYCTVTQDVFLNKNTIPGEQFLQTITPGGAQYALPKIFGSKEVDTRVLAYFTPEVLTQISEYYGFALATKNWDANIGGLGFNIDQTNDQATGLMAFDFEQSLTAERGGGYANPFSPCRLSFNAVLDSLKNLQQPWFNCRSLAKKISIGLQQIDAIARESKNAGFCPDENYVADLKYSMDDLANTLHR